MKKLLTIFLVIIMLLVSTGDSYASNQASMSSAKLVSEVSPLVMDDRARILEGFLLQYDSPLAPYAGDFIKYADEYNLDWRLVASIAGLESTFGKRIPYQSYNGWGWGVYGDNVINFDSWTDGIETISHGLRTRYLKDKPDSDPYFIGPTYASSPTWAVRVTFFMNKMEEYRLRNAKTTLALAL